MKAVLNVNTDFCLRKRCFRITSWIVFVLIMLMFCSGVWAKTWRVAQYRDDGTAKEAVTSLPSIIATDPAFEFEFVNGDQIRAGILDYFDILILPGGSGMGEAKSMQQQGVDKVKEFVRSGHGLLGICAGAYFPMQQDFINAQTKDSRWKRGHATVKIEVSEEGKKVFGDGYPGLLDIVYANGPIMKVNVYSDRPQGEVLAWFRSEVAQNDTPKGIQINSPAILLAKYGKGTIITSSPHAEQTKALHGFILKELHYLASQLNPDPAPKPVIGTPDELREKALSYMRAMASIEWVPQTDIIYYTNEDGVIFHAGEKYHGLPYTQPGRYTSLEEFRQMLETRDEKPVYVGPVSYNLYRGTDCSSSVTRAWKQVRPTFPILRTPYMFPGKTPGIVRVGDYKVTSLESTKQIIKDNGSEKIAAAYDKLLPGDALMTQTPEGHVRMVCRVDVKKRVVYIIEQTGLNRERKLKSDHQSWRVDYPFSYDDLLNYDYIPISLQEFQKK